MLDDHLSATNSMFTTLPESWLKVQSDAEVNIDGYTIFCQDRNQKKDQEPR